MWVVEIICSEGHDGRKDVGHDVRYCSSVNHGDEACDEAILDSVLTEALNL